MIVVQLQGGLGNQMFQYALGRRIALINDAPLKLDLSKLARNRLRTYKLKHFKIEAEIATSDDVMKAKGGAGVTGYFIRRLDRFKPHYRRFWVQERYFHFDPNILTISGTVFLEGYWQSEKYFADIREIICREFIVKPGLEEVSRKLEQRIQSTNSVSLHVRRGDYVTHPATRELYDVCSLDYYYAAVNKLIGFVARPHFFVFSDDLDWVQENLKLPYSITYITHNGSNRDYEDLRLMSLCQHNIIANSTFSWWGAWLNPNPSKVVVAPSKWFNSSEYDTTDLIPTKWIQI